MVTFRPGVDIVLAGPNGLLETLPAAGDDATWFPNLYDDLTWVGPDKEHGGQITRFQTPSPLLKYDQLFGTSARQWEAAFSQNKDISRWPGHCLGGAVASILLNEPTPAPGRGMTRDELKALWAELGENHYNHRIGDYANEIPPGPPRPGYDASDWKAPRVHAMLETHIRGEKKPLLANLRAFPPRGTINEVWNHGVYKYIATYTAIPGRGPACRQDLGRAARQLGLDAQRPGRQGPGRQLRVQPGLRPGRQGRRDQPGGGRLDLGGRRSAVRPVERARAGRIALGRPQPASDRGERPVARPGQRRRQPAAGSHRLRSSDPCPSTKPAAHE